ncbi:MAG TPA: amino acid adenylation domain-containing protein, partial [Longimicrobium sp.]
KTAAAFVPDPFGEPGARLYRTGDLGRWRPDGTIDFLGRADTQVKVRGFRIEPGEIEARLAEHEDVREAVVLARETAGDRQLVAYYTGEAVETDALRAHLSQRLPEYMVPAAYVHLEALPLTPNGKVDRRALPAPGDDAYARRGYEAPVGETERALAEIWAELLGLERVGRRDSFFELGGHSLLVVQLTSRIRQVLGAEVEIGLVFERPSLRELAEALAAAGRADLPPIERADRSARLPLSFTQQRLWFIEQFGNLGSTYHVPGRLRLRGELDREALVRALDRLVARHEALRTTFSVVNGEPEQRIGPETSGFHLVEHDLAGEGREAIERVMDEEAAAPFDLERGPLIRGRLVRLAEDDHVLLLTMHHIVSDGWSIGVLFDELGRLYAAFRAGRGDPLPPLPIQYADYAAWQRRWVEDRVLEAQAGYWTRTLAGTPGVLELPTDHPRPQQQDHAGASLRVKLDAELTAGLKALSRRNGTTLFMTLLAGWATVLGRLAGQDDVVVGTPTANRGRREIEGLIGFFVNTLALRVDLSEQPTVAQVLARVKARTLEAQANQDIPFEQVVELVKPERSLSHTPLFQVVFNWSDAPRGGAELPGLRLGGAPGAERTTAKFDLMLSLAESGGRITGAVEYATSLWERETVERHVGYLRRVLEQMAADERRVVDRLELLDAAERCRVVEEWNATDRPYPADGLRVHDLFRAQAARTPHAVALSWRGERWTYAELEARANRLANTLRHRGVGPEVRVGICLPRTPDLVAALLGVLGAGGAYVPLDPAYPRERLAWMLEDAAVALVITESALADRLPDETPALLLLDVERGAIATESADTPESGALPGNLSHVIFTSGSTGRPKGVMIRHSSVVVLLHWLRENVTDEERRSVLFSTSINFDVSVAEIFGTLAWGGKLVLVENALELATVGEDVVHASMVPSAAAELLRGGGIPASVKTLNLGGEALPGALAQGLYALGTVEKVGNLYGPTEDTTYSTYHLVPRGAGQVRVGTPVANTRAYVLDPHLQPVPVGVAGELYLAGDGLSRGYASRPAMTAERFVPCPFGPPGARMYRVMDRVRRRADGEIEYLGRTDFQVKVRGFRIEPGEIEARLREHDGVREAVVVAREDAPGDRRLVAYYVGEAVEPDALRAHLSHRLPGYMVPAAYVRLERLPLTPSGKVDRRALPAPARAAGDAGYLAPRLPLEQTVAAIWAEVLGVERVGVRENFFDLGGHSLLLLRVQTRLQETLGREVPLMDLFRFTTVAALTRQLDPGAPADVAGAPAAERVRGARGGSGAIAVVGMAGRFPGAADVERFWSNLRDGVHSITVASDEALVEAGTNPALLRDPSFVRAQGVLEGVDLFDAGFFGINAREAEVLDPQQRIFLETAWEALENAGHVPGSTRETVGVFAGSGGGSYFTRHVRANPEVAAAAGGLQAHLGNAKDFLALRTAYMLNLRGPALTVQTACSTGLVAVHLACQALAAGECDLALAGGVAISLGRGHRYTPGGIMSPDGHCRAFDARAGGTVGGSGIGLVVLRRLEDALADGDTIHAVVLGSAINNDGSQKVGFTAPSVDAQAAVVARALAAAGVEAESIGFVEAHGTGTELGDPVEVAALTRAFGAAPRRQSVALGSVKTNIGHLDAAAGAAGLIKAVLAVEHGQVPPTLHFAEPNPRIDFAASPFFVNTGLRDWPVPGPAPRRAGVTSLGMGGTNAHVVLEEAPPAAPSTPARDWHVLTLSAKTPEALEAATDRLAAHLRAHPEQALADVAYTLQVGRQGFERRRVLVARDAEDAAAALEARTPKRVVTAAVPEAARRLAFVFPGLGNHHAGMGRGVYESEPVFREVVDRCAEILLPWLGEDIREALYGDPTRAPEGPGSGLDLRALLGRAERDVGPGALTGTRLAQPAMFVTVYALERLWLHWGVRPQAMIGHSLGEYVAATVAGVWSLEDALMLVAERARLMEETPPGGMMGLAFTEEEIAPYLRDGLCIGARNGPSINVVSGPAAAVDALQAEMAARGLPLRRLPAKHAFHSRLMEPVAGRLAELMRGVRLHPPTIPFTSSVTGTWITADEATDPEYWRRHLVSTVRFSEGVETLAAAGFDVLLEVGAGNTVGGLALQHPVWDKRPPPLVVALRHQFEVHPDDAFLLDAAGRLWAMGVEVDWAAVHGHERLRRVPLPAYPFERRRYWLEPRASSAPAGAGRGDPLARRPDPADWLYLPAWTRAELPPRTPLAPAQWLVLADEGGIGGRLAGRLQTLGHTVVVARAGDRFARVGDAACTLRPGHAEDLAALRDALETAGIRPRRVVHLWGTGAGDQGDADAFARAQARGLLTVTALAATFAQGAPGDPLQLTVVTEGVRDVSGGEAVRPERATVLGACLALPHEHPRLTCRTVDICSGAGGIDRLADQLAEEVVADAGDDAVALRGAWRWVLGYQAVRPREGAPGLRPGGAYLFSGGMAGGAEVLAEHLAGTLGARIAVVVDPAFPAREAWDAHPAPAAAAATLRGIRAAEARGGEVLILRAAPGDAAALGAAVAAAGEAFGALHGVIHNATPGTGGDPSGASSAASVARELAALDEATAGVPLDFRLLQGSLFSVFGGAGVAATAAFALMDAWAQRRAGEGARWTSVSWDRWHLEEGGGAYAEAAIRRGDGARVFESLAALAREPRLVVSTHDLEARIERLRPAHASAAPPDEAGAAAEAARPGPEMHPRPRMGRQYQPPASDAEAILARIWSELLGFQEVGVQDSFFDLGGHSLLGIRLLARVREAFRVELPLRAVFEAPTITGLAALVDQAIVEELDAMSEEEAERVLAGLGTGSIPAARG